MFQKLVISIIVTQGLTFSAPVIERISVTSVIVLELVPVFVTTTLSDPNL